MKYETLLKGLEATEIPLSEIVEQSKSKRMDSQFFSKQAIEVEKQLKTKDWTLLGEATEGIESFGAYDLTNNVTYQQEGIPFLRCMNIKSGTVNFNDALYISETAHKLLWKSEVRSEMVLLTMSGSVGSAAVALPEWDYPINSNQDIAKITVGGNLNPYFLATFFSSSYGQVQIQRLPVGSVQQHVFLWMIGELVIPKLSTSFQKQIERTMRTAYAASLATEQIYTQAETLLLCELGMANWQPPEPLAYTKQASEAFLEGRLDAEFFRPRCTALKQELSRRFPMKMLGETGKVLKGVTTVYYEDGTIPMIRSGDLTDISDDTRFLKTNPTEQVFQLMRGDVLISSIGFGSIGKVQVFDKTGTYGTVSEVTVVRQTQLNPYFLMFFLRSSLGQLQLEQYITGATGQLHLYPRDVNRIFVPLVSEVTQKKCEELALAAHTARQKAKQLLEAAKRAVEVAIEQDEAAGMAVLARAADEENS